MTPTDAIASLLLSLLANISSDGLKDRKKTLDRSIEQQAIIPPSGKSFREQLKISIVQAAKQWPAEPNTDRIRKALSDDELISDICSWLVSWNSDEKPRLAKRVMKRLGVLLEMQEQELKEAFPFDRLLQIEHHIFENQKLTAYRLSLGMTEILQQKKNLQEELYAKGAANRKDIDKRLSEIATDLKSLIVEARKTAQNQVLQFTQRELSEAISRYLDLTIESSDVVDLANLPENDRHIALRKIYVPLRFLKEGVQLNMRSIENRRLREKLRSAGRKFDFAENQEQRRALGYLMHSTNKLVILGDPGSGEDNSIKMANDCINYEVEKRSGISRYA